MKKAKRSTSIGSGHSNDYDGSLIYLDHSYSMLSFSSYRISDWQTTPLDEVALFRTEYGWYDGTVLNRISNDGSIALWNDHNIAFFNINSSRTTLCPVDDSIGLVINSSSNTWYIGGDSSGIFRLQDASLQRVNSLPYIEKLVCVDSTGTKGLVKYSTIAASTTLYLSTYMIVDLADPENGIEIGRSTSE